MIGTCPEAGVMQRFLNGSISESDASLVAAHLSQCYTCRSSAITLSSFDLGEHAARSHSGLSCLSLPSAAGGLDTDLRGVDSSSITGTPDLHFLSPAQEPGELGRLGPYRVTKVLGEGGMGIVLQGEDVQLGRSLALKVMRPTVSCTESSRKRFLLEARATAAIEHENIVTIYQVGEDRGVPYLAMQLLQGESLDDRLRTQGALPAADVLWIGRQVALGLAAAHDQGLVHRDVKPSNIWLEAGRQRIKILDFGLARQTGRDSEVTKVGMILGTPAYMAPEQAGSGVIDFRSDLFSLGCVLYHMATGEQPYKGVNSLAILRALAVETPRPIHEINPAMPQAFSDLVASLLSKEPQHRPVSAQAVAEALAALQQVPSPSKSTDSGFFSSLDSIELAPLEPETVLASRSASRNRARAQASRPTRPDRPAERPAASSAKPRAAHARRTPTSVVRQTRTPRRERVATTLSALWDEVSPGDTASTLVLPRSRESESWVPTALVAGGLSFVAALSVGLLIWIR